MSGVTLYRIDRDRHMNRFYRLDVQRDLFGQWCFIREWGRIGAAGRIRSVPYPAPADAEAALAQLRKAKERRGYTARWTEPDAKGMPTIYCVSNNNEL